MTRIGPYEVVAELPSGGMARIYLGMRSGPGGFRRPVAIKTLQPNVAMRPEAIDMLMDEARIAARIQHPNVVGIEELGESDGSHYIAMEYVHGTSLAQFLGSLSGVEKRLMPHAAGAIAMRVAAGLHSAHELRDDHRRPLNVVHRDVSPQNILLGVMGEVKLIDFGIARSRGRLHETHGTEIKGKLRYMSPEQLKGRELDRRSDIFSLGIVLWEMLTMRRLFKHMGDVEVIQRITKGDLPPPGAYSDVPFEVDQLVLQCLASDPARRPETAREVRMRLKAALPETSEVGDVELAALLAGVVGILPAPEGVRISMPRLGTLDLQTSPPQALASLTRPIVEDEEEARTTVHPGDLPFARISARPLLTEDSSPSGSGMSTGPMQAMSDERAREIAAQRKPSITSAKRPRAKATATKPGEATRMANRLSRPWYRRRRFLLAILLVIGVVASMYAGYLLLRLMKQS